MRVENLHSDQVEQFCKNSRELKHRTVRVLLGQ